ncbi:WhiB family transcriptional regulator [Nonomuraea sp. NPDC059194]|uniref:WhiB family transcriptional regulator n=1 Tax=Nonomuraea sp. NPDC059194 TaxID=3346764 RepID=UPI0036940998
MAEWSWQNAAACRGEPLWLFFGSAGERHSEREEREAEAKSICAQCPVRAECATYALSRPEKYGTWGGLNPEERASERRRRQRRALSEMVRIPEDSSRKRCRVCEEVKPVTDYGRANDTRDGLNSACKRCTAAMSKQRRDKRKAAAS